MQFAAHSCSVDRQLEKRSIGHERPTCLECVEPVVEIQGPANFDAVAYDTGEIAVRPVSPGGRSDPITEIQQSVAAIIE